MTDLEPFDSFKQDAGKVVRSFKQRMFDRLRDWLTTHLVALVISAIAAGTVASVVLPVIAAVACGVVVIAAVIFAIWANRLMQNERRNRRWAYVQGKRMQQRELRALAAVDAATLAISGDRQVRVAAHRNPELVQAIAYLRLKSGSRRWLAGPSQPALNSISQRCRSLQI